MAKHRQYQIYLFELQISLTLFNLSHYRQSNTRPASKLLLRQPSFFLFLSH